jgi:hypothetical protein
MRRDDPSPAPWEKGAKKFKCIFPDIDKEIVANGKRKADDDDDDNDFDEDAPLAGKGKSKKMKIKEEEVYVVEDDVRQVLLEDELNDKIWRECLDFKAETKLVILIFNYFSSLCNHTHQ